MKIASNSKDHKAVNEFITQSPYLTNLPPPYQITYNSKGKSKCLININAMVVDDTRVIMAECIDIMDVVKDVIPNAMLIPSKYKHNIEDDDEEMEVETITINDKTYYTNNKKHGNLFEISENDSVGNSIGNLINSVPYFF